jgi:mRNA-degrading endonuclease RelE of RelBE toxin-antitoxin system
MREQMKLPEFSNKASKRIKRMSSNDKASIKKSILGIPKGDIIPLKGSKNSYRLRDGKWRILFSWIDNEQILIQKIDVRGQVY